MTYISTELRARLIAVDDHRCAYCRTTEANSGHPMTIDHIVPQSQGGPTAFSNLCYACRRCNEFKGRATSAQDPLTGEIVPLFHSRIHIWGEHFNWDSSGIQISGLTATGRATVIALKMNNSIIVDTRRRWVTAGWHPPSE